MAPYSELEAYRMFTGPAEMQKSINELIGILTGILADGVVDSLELAELKNWYELHRFFIDRHPFNEIIPAIDSALSDNILDTEEVDDILWLCRRFTQGGYYDNVTGSIQRLHGILHGVLANRTIVSPELGRLKLWLEQHAFLTGTYPFDEIRSLLESVLADGVVTEDEHNMLVAFFSEFIDIRESVSLNESYIVELREQYSIQGICAFNPNVEVKGRTFSFTGVSSRATRAEIANQVMDQGGFFAPSPTKKTDYLVVGADGNPCWAFSCYGRKIEKAMSLRKDGIAITLLNENDFWSAMEQG